jgi:hypothetical protein
MPLNKRSLELQALADAAVYEGATIRVSMIDGYSGNDHEQLELQPPVLARVVKTPREDVLHWTDGFIDPYWDVELLEDHPDLPTDFRNPWVYGISYGLEGEIEPSSDWELVELA